MSDQPKPREWWIAIHESDSYDAVVKERDEWREVANIDAARADKAEAQLATVTAERDEWKDKKLYTSKKLSEYAAEIERLEAECERLNKVIAKELSENDELGAEYTYVNALKAEVAECRLEMGARHTTIKRLEAEVERLKQNQHPWALLSNVEKLETELDQRKQSESEAIAGRDQWYKEHKELNRLSAAYKILEDALVDISESEIGAKFTMGNREEMATALEAARKIRSGDGA